VTPSARRRLNRRIIGEWRLEVVFLLKIWY